MTNNTRFLILPWVDVPHLASHVLGLIARRIREDWQAKCGHPVHALEGKRPTGGPLFTGLNMPQSTAYEKQ